MEFIEFARLVGSETQAEFDFAGRTASYAHRHRAASPGMIPPVCIPTELSYAH